MAKKTLLFASMQDCKANVDDVVTQFNQIIIIWIKMMMICIHILKVKEWCKIFDPSCEYIINLIISILDV